MLEFGEKILLNDLFEGAKVGVIRDKKSEDGGFLSINCNLPFMHYL